MSIRIAKTSILSSPKHNANVSTLLIIEYVYDIDILPVVLTNIIKQYLTSSFPILIDDYSTDDTCNDMYEGYKKCIRVYDVFVDDKYISFELQFYKLFGKLMFTTCFLKKYSKHLTPLLKKYFLVHSSYPDYWYTTSLITYEHKSDTPQTNILQIIILLYNMMLKIN